MKKEEAIQGMYLHAGGIFPILHKSQDFQRIDSIFSNPRFQNDFIHHCVENNREEILKIYRSIVNEVS